MAEKPSVMLTNGGLWNTRKPEYSASTTKLLKSKAFYYYLIEYIISSILFSTYG
jgi:hypothetical protein